MAEKILAHYKHTLAYSENPLNAIGATDSILRSITAHSDSNSLYVKKFGTDFAVMDITNAVINTPRSAGVHAWTYDFLGWNGTAWVSMGSVRDAGGVSEAFTDGAEFSATKIKIIVTPDAGDTISITNADTITLTADGETTTIKLSGESLTIPLTWYLSNSGSTYYDENYMYGGARHTADGTQLLPYFGIQNAINNVDSYHAIITVLDSKTYDEELTLDFEGLTLQADDGKTPTITSGIGARITREAEAIFNNFNSIYFNENGNDSTGTGKWGAPYRTLLKAFGYVTATKSNCVYGGINASTYPVLSMVGINLAKTVQWTITTEYGRMPTLFCSSPLKIGIYTIFIAFSHTTVTTYDKKIRGYVINSNSVAQYGIFADSYRDMYLYDSTIKNNFDAGIYVTSSYGFSIYCYRSIFDNCNISIRAHSLRNNQVALAIKNIFKNCSSAIRIGGYSTYTYTITVQNNIFYNISDVGWRFSSPTANILNGDIDNNLFYNCTNYGLLFSTGAFTIGLAIDKNIFVKCGTAIFSSAAVTANYNDFFDNITKYNANVTSTNEIITDPRFCKTTLPFKLGLSANSGALKTDGSEGDIGAILRNILISANDVLINGFKIDGQEQYNNAVGKTGATDYTGLMIIWCSIHNYQGIAIDDYSGADTETAIENCIIKNNGNGIKFSRGNNATSECLIYNNIKFGVHADYGVDSYTGHTFIHCIFYNNYYGLYFESDTGGVAILNCIFNQNSLYAIFSEVSISFFYTDNTDALSNVDDSGSTNKTDSPLFVSTDVGDEDFHIKTREGGYKFDSACKGKASDGYDIGAYLINRIIDSDSWKKYQFEFNPRAVSWNLNPKALSNFENSLGESDSYAKAFKRIIEMSYSGQVSSEELRQKLEYFSQLIKTRENGLTDENVKFRIHLQPVSFLLSSTGTIDSTTKIITDATINIIENQFKGFHCGIKFETGAGMVIDAAVGVKTATVSGAGWAPNEWEEYFLYINNFYYIIKSNTGSVLSLADPDNTLISETIDYSIEKYFKILSNEVGSITLKDEDDELINGNFDYYIDFMECKVHAGFKYNQSPFIYTREHSKKDFSITWEEI